MPQPHTNPNAAIKILLPKLPLASKIAPYLEKIDSTRTYSNYGPLSAEFARQLSELTGGTATLTSNGTTAIEIALRLRAKSKGICLMPAFTFIASAHAVCNAGLTPHLVEVDQGSLTLTPEIAELALSSISDVAAVLVVSAFGSPPDLRAWEQFEEKHNIPVVFDGAAAVTSLSMIGFQPVCVSLHATKVLGIGEGGAIICNDPEFSAKAKAMTGFGFMGVDRLSSIQAGNYRISEYAAAVGLAVMDGLPQHLQVLRDLTGEYTRRLSNKSARTQKGVGTDWLTMTLNVIVPSEHVEETVHRLDSQRIQWRLWWGLGCHRHPAFASVPAADLQGTDSLAPRVIGLPFHDQLTNADLDRVVECLL